jgi:hypothetical protein
VWKKPSKRSDQGTIGRPKLRALMLANQHVPQQHQFHVLGELSPPAPNEQPQNNREREVSEGEEHKTRPRAMNPERANHSNPLLRTTLSAPR